MISRALLLQLATLSTVYAGVAPSYKADLTELGNTSVEGLAFVSILGDGAVAYAGFASGVTPNLSGGSVTNALGAHIHSGTSCESTAAQGGHYFDASMSDPWTTEEYTSDADGIASFGSVLDIGTTDVVGRAFVIHDENGARVACGVLTLVEDNELLVAVSEEDTSESGLDELSSSGVSGSAVVYNDASSGYVCFAGTGEALEQNLDASTGDCTSTNGCGAHIHSGTSCVDSTVQGGHFYDAQQLGSDPWANAGYRQTTSDGVGYFVGCLKTGEDSFEDKAFVLHNNVGSRVACGVLKGADDSEDEAEDSCGPFESFLHWILFVLTFGTVRLPCA